MRMILSERRATRRTVTVSTGVISAVLVVGCGGGSSDGANATADAASDQPAIVATTTIWADVTSRVACGADVTAIVPAGADPHAFEPSLQDRERLDRAGVVIANGSDLEESLVDLLATIADDGVELVELTEHVDLLGAGDRDHEDRDHTDDDHTDETTDHDHAGEDPHIWQDPTRVASVLDTIAEAVVATGRDAAAIAECADAYRAELMALDTEIADALAPIPAARRVMVTNHDAFGYFADRYDLEIIGTVIPSMSTMGDSSAGQLAALESTIDEYDAPAIFTEELAAAGDAEALADRLDVAVVPLVSDSLSPEGPASTYIGMMRTNAQAIATALS